LVLGATIAVITSQSAILSGLRHLIFSIVSATWSVASLGGGAITAGMSDFVIVPYGGTTMNVSLTPQLEAMIRRRVESGRYNNASEVVREALRLLEEHEQVMHLRSLLAVGLEDERRGDLVEFTPEYEENLSRRVEERFLRGEEPNPDVCP
jgi:antitoxin ParD1/3/4